MSDDPTGSHPDSMDLPGKEVNPPQPKPRTRRIRKPGIRRIHVGALIRVDTDADIEAFAEQDGCTRSFLLSKYIEAMVAARKAGGTDDHAIAAMLNHLRDEGFIQ